MKCDCVIQNVYGFATNNSIYNKCSKFFECTFVHLILKKNDVSNQENGFSGVNAIIDIFIYIQIHNLEVDGQIK